MKFYDVLPFAMFLDSRNSNSPRPIDYPMAPDSANYGKVKPLTPSKHRPLKRKAVTPL